MLDYLKKTNIQISESFFFLLIFSFGTVRKNHGSIVEGKDRKSHPKAMRALERKNYFKTALESNALNLLFVREFCME
jgi:hypothetical protein